jgi:hypothetical protein
VCKKGFNIDDESPYPWLLKIKKKFDEKKVELNIELEKSKSLVGNKFNHANGIKKSVIKINIGRILLTLR